MCRILRRDDEERHGQRTRHALYGYLLFFHRFQQRALRLGCGAVHFVGQDHLRENRAGMEFEIRRVALIYRHAQDVGGQQVAGELDALELQAQRARQHMRQRGFAHTRQVFDEQMSACQQTG
jgi:hypothetical protein